MPWSVTRPAFYPVNVNDPKEIQEWRDCLVDWFRANGKSYPWRETTDPYRILVSELMLQQTRIATVIEKGSFENWLHCFPNLETLAQAEEDEVLKAWEGLGYYNRARHLHRAAKQIVENYGGEFPDTLESMRKLPGVGPYTAGAVLSFAFGKKAPILDGNVTRVLARVFYFGKPVDSSCARLQFWDWAEQLTPQSDVRDYNSAVMELGQEICVKSSPTCCSCPVSRFCESKDASDRDEIPRKGKRIPVTHKEERVLFLEKDGEVFLVRERGARRRGLWRLPEIDANSAKSLRPVHTLRYAITRYQVTMTVFVPQKNSKKNRRWTDSVEGAWFPIEGPLPATGAPYTRAIHRIKEENPDVI